METLPKISILRRFVFLCLMSRRPVACFYVQIVLKGIFLWNQSHFILLLYTDIPTGTLNG